MKKSIILLAAICILLSTGCEKEIFNGCVKGEGDREGRSISLPELIGVKLKIDGEIILYEGETQNIRIESESNVIDAIIEDSEEKDGIWHIDIKGCSNIEDLRFHITIPNLQYVGVSGDGVVRTDSLLSGLNELMTEISGDGDFNLNFDSLNTFNTKINGDGKLNLSGNVDNLNIDIDGDGEINAFSFASKVCNIKIDGNGDCQVLVEDELSTVFNGSGTVCYKGTPTVSTTVNGDGEVKSCN